MLKSLSCIICFLILAFGFLLTLDIHTCTYTFFTPMHVYIFCSLSNMLAENKVLFVTILAALFALIISFKLAKLNKINSLKSANFALCIKDNTFDYIIPVNTEYEPNTGWVVYTNSPALDDNNCLKWSECKHKLDEFRLKNKKIKNNDLSKWQEIGQLVKKQIDIENKINEYKEKINKIEEASKVAISSSVYSKYIEQYERAQIFLQNEVDKGRSLVSKIHLTIRELLISIKLADAENYLNHLSQEFGDWQTSFDEQHQDVKQIYEFLLNEAEVYLHNREEFLTQIKF